MQDDDQYSSSRLNEPSQKMQHMQMKELSVS